MATLGFLDKTAEQQMKRMSERREESAKWVSKGQLLTPHAEKVYKDQEILSHRCEVLRSDAVTFYVTYTQSTERKRRCVDLSRKTCTCLKWQQREIPCLHAIAAARADDRLSDLGTCSGRHHA